MTDGLNTRGWFMSDEDHEEFESLCAQQKYESMQWEDAIGWVRSAVVFVVLIAAGIALKETVFSSYDPWAVIRGCAAVVIILYIAMRLMMQRRIAVVRRHSYEREVMLDRMVWADRNPLSKKGHRG